MSVWIWWEVCQTRRISEVIQAHGCHDTNQNIIMAEIRVDFLIERERIARIIESAVDRTVRGEDVVMVKSGEEFL